MKIGTFNVALFSFFSNDDEYNLADYNDGNAWSRIYEYPFVERFLASIAKPGLKAHNSSWGCEGVHVVFRQKLEAHYDVLSSDVVSRHPTLSTYAYNILRRDESLIEKFDVVLNVSTIESLHGGFRSTRTALTNLFEQVKPGGHLVVTFDYPDVNLAKLEKWLGCDCRDVGTRLDGANSHTPNPKYARLNVVKLIIRKDAGTQAA